MPEIRSLTREKPLDTVIDVGEGDTINLRFDANKVTPAWVARTSERVDAADTLSLPKVLSEVILEWDVLEDGLPYEPTSDHIAVLSFPIMSLLFEAVMDAAVPGVAEGNASSLSANAPPTATSNKDSLSFPNGSEPSPSPASSPAPSLT